MPFHKISRSYKRHWKALNVCFILLFSVLDKTIIKTRNFEITRRGIFLHHTVHVTGNFRHGKVRVFGYNVSMALLFGGSC